MKTSYGIVTCNRPNHYLGGMLESLSRTGFFETTHLSVGHHDGTHLDHLRDNARFIISTLTPKQTEEFRFDQISRGARCSLGHLCCIRTMLQDKPDLLVVFEDDGQFARGWRDRMNKAIAAIQALHGDRWVLSLFHGHRENQARYEAGQVIYPADPATYFGSQGIVYPREVAEEFLGRLHLTVQQGEKAIDTAMKRYALETNIPLYYTSPCLMEHMGQVSVGCNPPYNAYFYRAGYFIDPIPTTPPEQPQTPQDRS